MDYHSFNDIDILNDIDIPLYFFLLQIGDIIVSNILTYVFELDHEIYYGMHSKTHESYEGRKYNQILRAIFVLSAEHIKIDNKSINYLGSEATSPISAYIWMEKFKFEPISPPTIYFSIKK